MPDSGFYNIYKIYIINIEYLYSIFVNIDCVLLKGAGFIVPSLCTLSKFRMKKKSWCCVCFNTVWKISDLQIHQELLSFTTLLLSVYICVKILFFHSIFPPQGLCEWWSFFKRVVLVALLFEKFALNVLKASFVN